ncbi:MAG: 2-oxoacid:acceptor oxidoreductase subunit alpha [Victivallaceae bacterium]|nr:2-oxoacid:acceptor oxidoreductase subunit alpha [Victivallaceae bacterium]
MDLNIRIAGEAGQGLVSLGDILTGAFSSAGLHIFTSKSYMSRVRGGLNWYDVRIADSELFALKQQADLIIALSPEAKEILEETLSPKGIMLYSGDSDDANKQTINLDFVKIAQEVAGSKVMANAVAAGAIFAILGYETDTLFAYLKKEFQSKGEEIVKKNLQCAKKGYEKTKAKALKLKAPTGTNGPAEYMSGAAAMSLSAAVSGVKLVSAYPMTPGTATFTGLANLADKYGIIIEQAEDEISAINMICGAVYAGVPALTTTSGGGFALMCEGVSLAGMMELPIVIVIAQRPGPATGLPTRTAQEDLKFAINAGHGEFPRAIYAPGTIQQCYDLTRKALETAHKYQSPVIILTDQYLQDIQKNIGKLSDEYNPIDRHIVKNVGIDYKRYALDSENNGISPRALPGGKGLVICDSDEHDEEGHLTEDFEIRIAMHEKRMAKIDLLKNDLVCPDFHGSEDAELILVCWGSTFGACQEAAYQLNTKGRKTALLHYSQVWPLDASAVNKLLEKNKRIVVVEGNYTGQFLSLLKEQGLNGGCELMNRYDGLPFTAEFIMEELQS